MTTMPAYQGEVSVQGGISPDTHHRAAITSSGDVIKLTSWEADGNGDGRYRQVDRMFDPQMIDDDDGGCITFTGVSEELRDVVRTSDNKVTWVLKPRGCKSCR